MIIAFIIHTSPLMYQCACIGGKRLTYLNMAKQTVESILEERRKSQQGAGDRYLLMTCEQSPDHIKSGWEQSLESFKRRLWNLQCAEQVAPLADSMAQVLRFLNLNRVRSGVDTCGIGRSALNIEPTVMIVLSCGGSPSYRNRPLEEMLSAIDGVERLPFHWDQRIFYIGLNVPGSHQVDTVIRRTPSDPDTTLMNHLCTVTMGDSYCITALRQLQPCVRDLVKKLHPGVVVDFKFLTVSKRPERCFMFAEKEPSADRSNLGYWPIPEAYWPEFSWTHLPKRLPHPLLVVEVLPSNEPAIVPGFPVDRYRLSDSSRIIKILDKSTRARGDVWQVFMLTGKGIEKPFGYLKLTDDAKSVDLFLLPYNYPKLLPLVQELFQTEGSPSNNWLKGFHAYMATVPAYYALYLHRVFETMMRILPAVLAKVFPHPFHLSPSIVALAERKKEHAMTEHRKLCAKLKAKRANRQTTTNVVRIQSAGGIAVVLPTAVSTRTEYDYRKPYDIPRRDFLDAIEKLRVAFYGHSTAPPIPHIKVEQNRTDRLLEFSQPPARAQLENRQFNPYDRQMRHRHKRKPGPIAKSFQYQVPARKDAPADELTSGDEKQVEDIIDTIEGSDSTEAMAYYDDVNGQMITDG